jgi:putative sugar O-methyltransferase
MDPLLRGMFDCFSEGDPIFLPSKFWKVLNEKNIRQLESEGIDNLKQTVAQNYFTWVVGRNDEQFRYLVRNTPVWSWSSILLGQPVADRKGRLTWRQRIELAIFTRMLWKFVERMDTECLLESISEPKTGNPFEIFLGGKLISQDLANSILEYYAIRAHFKTPRAESVTFCELGAGYGRNAYVFLNAFPKGKYIIIDIPPALYVSQKYLSSVFPDKKVFAFRCFDQFSAVEQEFQSADIVFLLPHQATFIPEKCVDLFVNISSLHEMQMPQITAYFNLIDKLTQGFFYSKQWIVSKNPEDDVVISKKDYPIPKNWHELFSRQAKVQTHFFEAMYAVGSGKLS